jgi:hypothetical protein
MTGNTLTGIALPNQRETSMPTSREFRARVLRIANVAESIFDLAAFVEASDLRMPLERLGHLLGSLLNDVDEAASVAGTVEQLAIEDLEDAESRRLACGGRS